MASTTSVDPKHVLILGAGPGLSASIARRFAREGFAVTLLSRGGQDLAELADQLRDAGTSVDTVTADAGDAQKFRTVLEGLAERVAPGVVVYNAALIASNSVLTIDADS